MNNGQAQTFIGIDLGTTFLKGAVLDVENMRLGHAERLPFPDFVTGLPPGYREVDPQALVSAVLDLIRRLLVHAPHCSGLLMCTQMHGLVLTDEQGTALSNAITWQDQRALELHPSGRGSFYDVLRQHVKGEERLALGNDLWASRPLSALFWMREHADIRKALLDRKEPAFPASLPDFVLANLCHTAPTTDLTNAAAHGALHLETGEWHHTLIERLDLGHLAWPSIQAHGSVVGTLNVDGHKLPCYTPVGDHQCAVLGTLLEEDELSINVSTGSQVGVVCRQLDLSGDYQTRPYFDGRFLKAVIHIPAGRALNALVRLLTELAEAQAIRVPDPWAYITRAADAVGQTSLRVNLAFFPSSCGDVGAFENVREENLSVGHVFMGAFQNMAENFRACAGRVAPDRHYRRLVFSGGLVQKMEPLQRAILQQFGMDYRDAPSPEDTMTGLLALAVAFSGRAGSVTEATRLLSGAI